jgi:hypothetical protein
MQGLTVAAIGNHLTSIHWRASLVPAAAVIPAPIAYIKVVAVKKLVVEFRRRVPGLGSPCTGRLESFFWGSEVSFTGRFGEPGRLP